MRSVFKMLSVKRATFLPFRFIVLRYVNGILFGIHFFVGVFCSVFRDIYVHFCCFLLLHLHCFVNRFDFGTEQLLFPRKSNFFYGLHYSHNVFPSLFLLRLVYFFSSFFWFLFFSILSVDEVL